MKPTKRESRRRLSDCDGFKAEVKRWAEKMDVKPRRLRIQPMKKKWASCSSRGWVCFSTDLLKEPRDFQEYVIVHELLHLAVPNHGKLFKSLMNAYLPEWENVMERRNGKTEREM
jgi:predicted metal-dependent hydrolase